jgi:hypothetical protein
MIMIPQAENLPFQWNFIKASCVTVTVCVMIMMIIFVTGNGIRANSDRLNSRGGAE